MASYMQEQRERVGRSSTNSAPPPQRVQAPPDRSTFAHRGHRADDPADRRVEHVSGPFSSRYGDTVAGGRLDASYAILVLLAAVGKKDPPRCKSR